MPKRNFQISPGGHFPKPPKPEPPGKKPAPPKLKGGPDIEPLDVFKAVLNGDAGQESSNNPQAMFAQYFSYLSKHELKEIDRKIGRMCKKLLKTSNKKEKIHYTYDQFHKFVDHHLQISLQHQAALRDKISEKLEEIGVENAEFSSKGKVLKISVNGKWFLIRRFIHQFLLEEFEHAQQLIKDGVLVRNHKRHSGFWFIMGAIEEIFLEQEDKGADEQ